jgi:hypothetical protein
VQVCLEQTAKAELCTIESRAKGSALGCDGESASKDEGNLALVGI